MQALSFNRRFFPATLALFFLLPLSLARADETTLARHILEHAGLNRGLCAVLGADDSLPLKLAAQSELLVHVREPSNASVQKLRALAAKAGLPIQRLAIEHGGFTPLPYATNTVDLVVHTRAGEDLAEELPLAEVLRVLRPGGVALIGTADQAEAADRLAAILAQWAEPIEDPVLGKDTHGTWLQLRKPPLEGVDEWSHWEKSPDNNPVSNDAVIVAPYMSQFMATPYYIGMPAITTAAGGRTFLAVGHIAHHEREWDMLNRLIARNGYNGIVLWERDLPEGYLVHRSAFIATPETFHLMNGDHALLLDAATGAEKGVVRIPSLTGQWKWMARSEGVLYVLAGEPGPGAELVKGNRAMGGWSWADLSKGYYGDRIPHGFGDTLAAYDLEARKVLWTQREESLIDARGLAIADGRFLLYCPDKHLRALDQHTGETLWTLDDADTLSLIEEPGKGLKSTPGWRTQTLIVATPEALVIQGQTRMNVIAISPENGRFLWKKKKITNNPNALFIEGNIVVGVGPGGSNVALDPVSGEVVENLNFTKRACTRLTASTDSLFTRGEGMTRFDLATRKVTVDGTVRPGCNDGVIPA
ncbi:MAG: PQQ-binding-like beta-propeller repeat protein, partial [Verrucomicrobiales bacterium]